MAGPVHVAGPDEPDLVSFRRPTRCEVGQYVLALAVAADFAGVVPGGWGAGAAVALVASAAVVKRCARWNR